MASIRSLDITPSAELEMPTGVDVATLKQELAASPAGAEPDVRIEGDWVMGQAAAQKALLEYSRGLTTELNVTRVEAQDRLAIASAPGGLDADFGSGDSSVFVSVGRGYFIDNPGYSRSTTLYADGSRVATAGPAQRAVVFNPPGAEVAFLVGLRRLTYQFIAAAAVLFQTPAVGTSEAWRVPAFGTSGGLRSLSAVYSYTTPAPLRLPAAQFLATISVDRPATAELIIRNAAGEQATATEADLEPGDNNISMVAVNIPSTGYLEVHAINVPFSTSKTRMFPPNL